MNAGIIPATDSSLNLLSYWVAGARRLSGQEI